ncbi:MAG: hypothetical protein J6Q89_08440 [Clostridia bacterium]|nr:hypothetical protein [Clostridia bacterium]
MKKFVLLLFPILLCFVLIACDFSGEGENSSLNPTDVANQSSDVVNNGSSVTSQGSSSQNGQDGSSNPDEIVEHSFEIPISIVGADTLSNAGFAVDSAFSKKVTVTIEAKKSEIDTLDTSKFTATIDVSGVIETGDIEFLLDYKTPDGITIKNKSDDFVTVSITKKGGTIIPSDNPDAYMSNGIIVSGNRGMEAFGGTYNNGKSTAQKLNTFKEAVGEDVNVYIMPCPTQAAFYAPAKYSNSIKSHENCFNGIRENLVGVKYVDTLAALSPHTDEYIYLRTDFHWAALGAYYAAEELAKVAGTPFDNISTFVEKSADGFNGSLVGYASVLSNDPDTLYWYEPSREHTVTYYSVNGFSNPITGRTLFAAVNGYTKFIYGDSYTTQIQSNVNNGRKLLIVKDSYGNALAPFVLSSFEEVIIVDCREFRLNAVTFINEHDITDVCFAMSAFGVNGSKSGYITQLLNF